MDRPPLIKGVAGEIVDNLAVNQKAAIFNALHFWFR